MGALVVPTSSSPSYIESMNLEGLNFTLQFDFSQRACCWYMHVADQDGVDIYNGIKIVCGPLLLVRCADRRRPPGDFLCVSSTSDLTPPTITDLVPGSGRCTLLYLTSDWLSTIASGATASIAAIASQIAGGGGSNAVSPVSTYGQPST